MDVPHGYDPTLILVLNLAGTFVFGLSGGLAAVRAKLDLFGVVVLAAVVGLAGGITRDVLIGTPPATFRDWRYLAAAGAAGLICYFAGPVLERVWRSVLVFDAFGLGLFCVTGATRRAAARGPDRLAPRALRHPGTAGRRGDGRGAEERQLQPRVPPAGRRPVRRRKTRRLEVPGQRPDRAKRAP
jgi:hypothetical protein